MPYTDRVLAALIADRGNIRRISFTEDGRRYDCYVPEDSLWSAVKDNLVLAEYERAGIDLTQCHGIVLDAGAHVGLFSLRAAAYAARVIAIEPHPGNFSLLRINLRANDAVTVEPRNLALCDVAGEADFFEGDHSDAGSLMSFGTRRHRVGSVTLDQMIGELGAVDLLKLDIEGAEFSVLQSASDETLARIAAIVAELHPAGHGERIHAAANRLASIGFDVTLLRPPVYSWRDSTAQVLRRWRRVENVTRLKLTVLLVYSVTAVLDAVVGFRRARRLDDLMFLYAVRRT
jgi:FkbM family methyltransferase